MRRTVRIFHLLTPQEWAAAVEAGAYAPASLATEGFVHFSFADQVAGSAARHFATATDLVVLEVRVAPDERALRVEDSYGTGTAYPHLYEPLAASDVVAVHRMHREAGGGWEFSPDGAGAPASPDR